MAKRRKKHKPFARCFAEASAAKVALLATPAGLGQELKSAMFVPMGVHIDALKAGEWLLNEQDNEMMALANMMTFVGIYKPSASVYQDAQALGTIVYNLRTRFEDTGRWSGTGDELNALSVLFDNFLEYAKVLIENDIYIAFDTHKKWLWACEKAGRVKNDRVPMVSIAEKNWSKAFKKQMEAIQ